MKSIPLTWSVALLLLVTLIAHDTGQAQSPTVSLSVTPTSLKLAPSESGKVLIVATIPISTVQTITLSSFADVGVRVDIQESRRTTEPLQGSIAWTANITKLATGPASGNVYFRADYTQKPPDAQVIPGITTATLALQERPPDKIEQVITAKIQTALDKLEERRPRQLFIVINNISDVPVQVTSIRAEAPRFVRTTIERLDQPRTVNAQQSRAFSTTVEIPRDEQAQAGNYLLVYEISAEWQKSGHTTKGGLVLEKAFTVGIFGEQEFVGWTGIPLLLLPGFLVVLTFGLLWNRVWPKGSVILDFKKPEFYLFGILLAVVAVLVYPLISPFLYRIIWGRSVSPRDYLEGYSITDIFNVWIGALAAGALAWVVIGAGLRTLQWLHERWLAARTPAITDQPLDILYKLARQELGFGLKQVVYQKDNQRQYVSVLPFGSSDPTRIWGVPRIPIIWKKDDRKAQAEFQDKLMHPDQPRAMANLLRRLRQRDTIEEVRWDPTGALITAPSLIERSAAAPLGQPAEAFVYEVQE